MCHFIDTFSTSLKTIQRDVLKLQAQFRDIVKRTQIKHFSDAFC